MLTKTKISYIKSLQNKKTRYEYYRFVVEGKKSILEVLNSDFRVVEGFFVQNFLHPIQQSFPIELITSQELQKISSLSSNRDGIVIVEMKKNFLPDNFNNNFVLILDDINDPGNLGTIIRIADWYGIKNIIASKNTVDFYNPKTIMATMGSFARVNVFYEDLIEFFEKNQNIPTYGAFLNGENLRNIGKIKPGFIVIGSEAHGINQNLEKFIDKKITIPRFGSAESLNAGVATGIILERLIA